MTATNGASVCTFVRVKWACHHEHNERQFQPALPLNFRGVRVVQQRYSSSSSSSGTTPRVNLASLIYKGTPVFPLFNLRHPQELKSATSRRGTLCTGIVYTFWYSTSYVLRTVVPAARYSILHTQYMRYLVSHPYIRARYSSTQYQYEIPGPQFGTQYHTCTYSVQYQPPGTQYSILHVTICFAFIRTSIRHLSTQYQLLKTAVRTPFFRLRTHSTRIQHRTYAVVGVVQRIRCYIVFTAYTSARGKVEQNSWAPSSVTRRAVSLSAIRLISCRPPRATTPFARRPDRGCTARLDACRRGKKMVKVFSR